MPPLLRLLLRRGRGAPWLLVLQGASWLAGRGRTGWQALTPDEQRQLQRLLRSSRGRPARLDPSERDEVTRIVRKGIQAAWQGS